MSEWTDKDRERIALFKSGWSCELIAEYRKESVVDVIESVNKLLELLGDEET
jgi:hypothetical protein